MKMLDVLDGVRRCPHCGVARPLLSRIWGSELLVKQGEHYGRRWASYKCSSCAQVLLARTHLGNEGTLEIERTYPAVSSAAAELPDRARAYLDQAYESLSSPDGAAMLAGASVDAHAQGQRTPRRVSL